MDYNAARALLERYFAAETTAAEEAALRDYFGGEDVDPRLAAHAAWFDYLRRAGRERLPADFAVVLPARRRSLRWRGLLAAAAAVLLLCCLWWWSQPPAGPRTDKLAAVDWSKYEVQDPESAARILQASLRKAGAGLRTGTEEAAREMERLERLADPLD